MPVQVEPESPTGMRVWMVSRGTDPGLLPQGQGHPLSGVRPGWRCRTTRCNGVAPLLR